MSGLVKEYNAAIGIEGSRFRVAVKTLHACTVEVYRGRDRERSICYAYSGLVKEYNATYRY